MKILVTGGCGFIGSAVIREAISRGDIIINVDSLTYAAVPSSLEGVKSSDHYFLKKSRFEMQTL